MQLRTVFMGSPEFALPSLRILNDHSTMVGVITQPDRPAGRGQALKPPPVKLLAEELGLPVIQPRRLREPEAMQQLTQWQPELIVVAAFGQILRAEVLELPRFGCINVHASLLPRWRGAAPIQAAILNGDAQSGVTIMRMDTGIDTGPILSQRAERILPEDTAVTLSERLAEQGALLLAETLPGYLDGSIQPRPQDDLAGEAPTYAPMLKKKDAQLDFSQSASELERRVRAFTPWPGTTMIWQGQILKVIKARAVEAMDVTSQTSSKTGQLLVYEGLPAVNTSQGLFLITELQPAGKKPMKGVEFLRGARLWGK